MIRIARASLSLALAVTVPVAMLAPPLVTPVRAGPVPEPAADPAMKQLKDLYDQAHVAFLAGRYEDAAKTFDAGYEKGRLAAFLFNAAVAWERAGNVGIAIERYALYLVKEPGAADAQETQERLEKLRTAMDSQQEAQVTQLETKGVTIITSKPDGAEIRLDSPQGPVFAKTPFQGTLPAGEHEVFISYAGYKTESQKLPETRGKMLLVIVGLSEEYFLGHLEVRSPVAGAKVYLRQITDADGKPVSQEDQSDASVGTTPFSNQIPPGRYQLRVAKDGFKTFQADVDVKLGKVKVESVDLQVVDDIVVRVTPKTADSKGAGLFVEGDREPLCMIPCETSLSPGTHKLVVKKAGMKPLRFDVAGNKADLVEVAAELQPATKRFPAIVTGVLMAATAGTGIAFGIMASRQKSRIQADIDNNVQIDASDPRAQVGKRNAIIADAMFGATALLAGLTIFYMVRKTGKPSTGDKQQRSLSLLPAASPTGAGLFGEVRF